MRRLLAALALLSSCAFAQDRDAAPAKNWKDKAEFDLANAVATETDPAKKLVDLDKWAASYPASEFSDQRWDMYLGAYQQLNDARNAFDIAQRILQTRPNDLRALAAMVSQVAAIRPAPTPADVEAAEKAANLLINNPDTGSAAVNKTRNTPESQSAQTQWAQTRDQALRYATQVLTASERTPAAPIQKVEPQYSEEARLAGLEGSVLVTGTIASDGTPHNARQPAAGVRIGRAGNRGRRSIAIYSGLRYAAGRGPDRFYSSLQAVALAPGWGGIQNSSGSCAADLCQCRLSVRSRDRRGCVR
jgi:hypothetical protein